MVARSPLGRVRGLGSARSGTHHFWHLRVTSVASLPLTVAFIATVMAVAGRNHATAVQILASPWVALLMLLFIAVNVYHMWLGMQVVIEDYVHTELRKIALLIANGFFCALIGLASVYGLLKLSFGV